MCKNNAYFLLLLSGACMGALVPVGEANADDNVETIVKDGSFFGQARYRYEFVEQDGVTNDAKASTVRTNFGFKTGEYKGVQALIEGQIVQNIGADDFNNTVNGETSYPVVADPDVAELNRLWVQYSGLPDTQIKVGRQAINLDNQRFVGTVGWRQNDQTFDSALISYNGLENAQLQYGHIWNINRIFGGDHPLGDLETQSHIIRAAYQGGDMFNLSAYGYLLDIDRVASLSSQTYGARVTGAYPLNDVWSVSYEGEVALQEDYADNTADYDELYYHISPALKGHGLTVQAGYEVLGGDGTNSFKTPLATLHKFNGWADKFLTTPANGLEDAYAKIAYKVSDTHKAIDGTKMAIVYHDFDGNESGNYGTELDLSIGKSFALPEGQPFENVNLLLKYSDYNADDAPYTDTNKIWFQVNVTF